MSIKPGLKDVPGMVPTVLLLAVRVALHYYRIHGPVAALALKARRASLVDHMRLSLTSASSSMRSTSAGSTALSG